MVTQPDQISTFFSCYLYFGNVLIKARYFQRNLYVNDITEDITFRFTLLYIRECW